MKNNELILLTGATGYIGGRLLDRLIKDGRTVRCLVRDVHGLKRQLPDQAEIVSGDVFDRESLLNAMRGAHTAYYLIHSMSSDHDFEEKDRLAAMNFLSAAQEAGIARIIYLGGLGPCGRELSSHLRSRQEVGDILRRGSIPTIEFRASIVIGSGSLSYEMIRALVERLPVMVTPRWVSVAAQPIAINDLLLYLLEALSVPLDESRMFEIGGSDQVSYRGIMLEYARQRGLKRRMISVPFLTPYLSSLWLGLVTPVYARIGKHLIDGIRNPTVVMEHSAKEWFSVRPVGVKQAIESAIRHEDRRYALTRWSDALSSSGYISEWNEQNYGARIVDKQVVSVPCSVEDAFRPIRRIGGKTGWYYADWLWKVRASLDLLAGGIGIRRGRKQPDKLHVGEPLDWWRVEQFEPNRLVRLVAEMKVPGRAWLQFEVEEKDGGSVIHQTAIFDPLGLWGLLYWCALYPLHFFIFRGMLRNIAREALKRDRQ